MALAHVMIAGLELAIRFWSDNSVLVDCRASAVATIDVICSSRSIIGAYFAAFAHGLLRRPRRAILRIAAKKKTNRRAAVNHPDMTHRDTEPDPDRKHPSKHYAEDQAAQYPNRQEPDKNSGVRTRPHCLLRMHGCGKPIAIVSVPCFTLMPPAQAALQINVHLAFISVEGFGCNLMRGTSSRQLSRLIAVASWDARCQLFFAHRARRKAM
jgi:hypothetical protein